MILPLILAAWIVTAESYIEHSAMYAYTYMTKPPADKPAFYVERRFNGRVYASFSSSTNTSRPEVEWIKPYPSMWTRDLSRSNKHGWFKLNTDTLIARLNLSASDNHVLQWIHGCRATRNHLGRLVYIGRMDLFSFNYEPLMAFNQERSEFEGLDQAGAGAVIAAKYNAALVANYTAALSDKDFFENKCMDTLRKLDGIEAAV